MKIYETDYQVIFTSEDDQGRFEFRIQKDASQIQIENSMDDFPDEIYIDVCVSELEKIKEVIEIVLTNKKKQNDSKKTTTT